MIEGIVRPIWGKAVYVNRLNHVWEWKSGERLELNYFVDMGTFSLYQGKSFAWIGWEELTLQKNLEGYLAMFSTLRSPLPAHVMPRKVRFTCNPGGPSHNAVKHRFQLSGVPTEIAGPLSLTRTARSGGWFSVPSTTTRCCAALSRTTWRDRDGVRRQRATVAGMEIWQLVHLSGGALDDGLQVR